MLKLQHYKYFPIGSRFLQGEMDLSELLCSTVGMLRRIASLKILLTCGKQEENPHTLILYVTAPTQRF